jgi:addiction module HigA family antidote
MRMHNPPHPGAILQSLWLEPIGISITEAAQALGISRKTLSKIINGRGSLTPEMAVRLARACGTSPESWLAHQAAYDLWQLRKVKIQVQNLAA